MSNAAPSAPTSRTRRLALRTAASLALLAVTAGGCAVATPLEEETDTALSSVDAFATLWNRVQQLGRESFYTGVWTNWYHRPKAVAMVQLSLMRSWLMKDNLVHAYPPGVRTGFLGADVRCAPGTLTARTADGSCNDQADPAMGAAGTRFGHNVPLASVRTPSAAQLLTPNPRTVSRELLERDSFHEVPFLNLLAASWIQFMVHDWFSHSNEAATGLAEVPLASDDPLAIKYRTSKLFIPATRTDARRANDVSAPTYVNDVTHWWDGSQIYGSDAATVARLREFRGGRLRVDASGGLPVAADGVDDTGFKQNWWVGLGMMHDLFVREHNAIAARLQETHRDWNDERVFSTARLVNAAVMAKIHTVEWTPGILPNDVLESAMNANWYGLFSRGDRTIGAVNLDQNVLFGIVGNSRDLAGVPFSLTEEFVSVYRMHSLLPEAITIRPLGATAPTRTIPMGDTRDAKARALMGEISMTDLLNSFGTSKPGALVLHNYPKFMGDIDVPGFAGFDLGTIDVLRDRERGVPRYNEFRRRLQLKPITSFAQLLDDPADIATLERVYGGDVEKLDLQVGCLAEAHRPTNFGFGETAFQVFVLMASRRLMADRFYTDSYKATVYGKEGLAWIDAATMKSVLLRHYPALASSGLGRVKNAFKPW